jgi:hypothetical protein
METSGNKFGNDDSNDRNSNTDPSNLPFPPTQDYETIDKRLKSQDPAESPNGPESECGGFVPLTWGVDVFDLMVNNHKREVEEDQDWYSE